MFSIRLTLSDSSDPSYAIDDIQLPEVPAVGDIIEIDRSGRSDFSFYKVKARRFRVEFSHGAQVNLSRPMAMVTVEVIE